MTTLWLLLALVFLGLAVVLAIAASLMHTGFYEQPVEGLAWRAPVGAAVITAFLGGWTWLEYKSPGRVDSVFRYSASDLQQFDQFWSERTDDGRPSETLFHRHIMPTGRVEYVDAAGKPWRRSDSGVVTAILIEEDGERRRFVAQLGPNNTFLCEPSNPNVVEEVRYFEDGGKHRVMLEGSIGTMSSTRYSALFINSMFNLFFLIVWIVVIGLAFELQWSHAIVLGFIAWTTTLLLIWPALQACVPGIQ